MPLLKTNWKNYNPNVPFKWACLEKVYSSLFPSHEGRQAFPMRVALGTLIIQKRQGFSDRKRRYLAMAKTKKRPTKKLRSLIRSIFEQTLSIVSEEK